MLVRQSNWEQQSRMDDSLYEQLSPSIQCCVNLAKEFGSSSWLTILPIQEHGFHLHKGDFRDALSLWYGLLPLNTTKTCHCGTSFSVDHAMVCPFGSFPTIHHNEVCDLTATLLTEVCHNVVTEPALQPITTETFPYSTVNTSDDAHFNVMARGFWCRGQDAFLMSGYSIQMLPVIVLLVLPLHITAIRMQRSGNMATVPEKLNMAFSLLWCLPPLVMWVGRPLFSIKDLLATHWGQHYSPTIHWL